MLVSASKNVIPPSGPWRQGMGALPPNIVRECVQWEKGMQVDPDGYIWKNGQPLGVKECQPGGVAPIDVAMKVLSIPGDLLAQFRAVATNAEALKAHEAQLQGLCARAQDIEQGAGYRIPRPMADLLAMWNEAMGVVTNAAQAFSEANRGWDTLLGADNAAENGYTRGIYTDPQLGQEMMRILQSYNHVPLAWDNCNVAASCVRDALDYWVSVCWGTVEDHFATYENNALRVAGAYDSVQTLLAQLNADAAHVTLSREAAAAIEAAKPSMDELNALAMQVGMLWQQAQAQRTSAREGIDAGTPVAAEDARFWFQDDAWGGFYNSGARAEELAADIHSRLDATAKQLREYLVQHPEIEEEAAKKGAGKGVLVLGGVALLALIVKKAALFG